MKRMLHKGILLMLIAFMTCMTHGSSNAQPRPGANGDSTAVGGAPLNGSAPLGSGLLIFLVLGAAYGIRKMVGKAGKKNNFKQ
jgi:hypothetical protein